MTDSPNVTPQNSHKRAKVISSEQSEILSCDLPSGIADADAVIVNRLITADNTTFTQSLLMCQRNLRQSKRAVIVLKEHITAGTMPKSLIMKDNVISLPAECKEETDAISRVTKEFERARALIVLQAREKSVFHKEEECTRICEKFSRIFSNTLTKAFVGIEPSFIIADLVSSIIKTARRTVDLRLNMENLMKEKKDLEFESKKTEMNLAREKAIEGKGDSVAEIIQAKLAQIIPGIVIKVQQILQKNEKVTVAEQGKQGKSKKVTPPAEKNQSASLDQGSPFFGQAANSKKVRILGNNPTAKPFVPSPTQQFSAKKNYRPAFVNADLRVNTRTDNRPPFAAAAPANVMQTVPPVVSTSQSKRKRTGYGNQATKAATKAAAIVKSANRSGGQKHQPTLTLMDEDEL